MKIVGALLIGSMLLTGACKKDQKDPAKGPAAAEGAGDKTEVKGSDVKLAPLALASGGEAFAKLTIQAPEGATAKMGPLALEITSGPTFQLEITPSKADLASQKKEIQGNDVNKLKGFLKDSPDALLYQTEVMDRQEFHFVANVHVGDADFSCEDTKGPLYAQGDVEVMLKACQSLAGK